MHVRGEATGGAVTVSSDSVEEAQPMQAGIPTQLEAWGWLGVSLVTGLYLGSGWVPGRGRCGSRQAESKAGLVWGPQARNGWVARL